MGPRKGIPVLTSRHRTRIVTRDMNVNELIKLPSAKLKRILTLKAKLNVSKRSWLPWWVAQRAGRVERPATNAGR